ncbi:hypothetical protein [Actinomadura sediminis]|uniref:Uncharacterized protein n=1 Tax=Actinomadura sediminis TaxID=1038904 RepID=A0ABW3EQ89_9ACTN
MFNRQVENKMSKPTESKAPVASEPETKIAAEIPQVPEDWGDHCAKLGRRNPVCGQCAADRAFRLWGPDKIAFNGQELALVHEGSPYLLPFNPVRESEAVTAVRQAWEPRLAKAREQAKKRQSEYIDAVRAERNAHAEYEKFADAMANASYGEQISFGGFRSQKSRQEREFNRISKGRKLQQAKEQAEGLASATRKSQEEAFSELRELEAQMREEIAKAGRSS